MSEITPVGFDCWKYGDLYSEDQVNELESRIALLEKVAVHALFYLKGVPDADGYELDEALRAAGYGEGV